MIGLWTWDLGPGTPPGHLFKTGDVQVIAVLVMVHDSALFVPAYADDDFASGEHHLVRVGDHKGLPIAHVDAECLEWLPRNC